MKNLFTILVLSALAVAAADARIPLNSILSGLPPTGLTLLDNNDGTVDVSWLAPADLIGFTHYNVYRSQQLDFVPGPSNLLAGSLGDTIHVDGTVLDFHTYYYVVSANYDQGGSPQEVFSDHSAGILVNNTSQTTILGYAFLEGRQNHANIKVKFVPLSPSAVADSVYTNALGFFIINDFYPGIYSVHMSRPGFQTPLIHENLTIIEDTDLGETTLYDLGTTVSGNVSGVWSGFISSSGDVTVAAGDSLIIEAGTVIRLLGWHEFRVYGYLAANGVEGDSIRITSGRANQVQVPDQWARLRFYESADANSYLNHTIVEYARDGLYLQGPGITVEHSRISMHERYGIYFSNSDGTMINNSKVQYCGTDGIHMQASSAEIEGSVISNYSRYGVYMNNYARLNISASTVQYGQHGFHINNNSDINANGCTISDNSSNGVYFYYVYQRGNIMNCTISSNSNGINLDYASSPLINSNFINQNTEGILLRWHSSPEIRENVITENTNGIRFSTSSSVNSNPYITRNLIANNTNDGIHKHTSSNSNASNPTIVYNTIVSNGGDGVEINRPGNETIANNIIAFNGQWGLRANEFVEIFEYNNVYSNTSGEISNLSNLPPATWNFISTNPNTNASCDIYRNINEDPMFAGSGPQFYFLTFGSKCINGGSEDVKDPDGSISDIGAFPFDLGNPHNISAIDHGHQQVTLEWEAVANDSIVDYNVYYRLSGSKTGYTLFGNTDNSVIDVTGLTNNELYDFTVTGNYPAYESPYAPKVSEKPGVTTLEYDPGSFSILIPEAEASLTENFTLNNPGSRDLHVQFVDGNPGFAYFDGSGDYVSYGHHDHLHSMTALTMETWIYRQNSGHFDFMGMNYRNYQFAVNSSNRVYIYKGYGTPSSNSHQGWATSQSINTNQWYHLAMTWEGNTIWLFVNGVQVWQATNANAGPIPWFHAYPFEFGRRAGENSQYFQGRLAEARLWNVVRTADEIKNNMYGSLQGNEEGLIGYWPLQDDFMDHSQYGLSGNVVGDVEIQTANELPYKLFSVPQASYLVEPGQNEVIPITFYNRTDMTSHFFKTRLYSDDPNTSEFELDVFLQYGETVPATPVYFTPVSSTGKPYTIVITDAKIDGQTIQVGDEIGVFDGELCVGAGIFNGTFNFILNAWESDNDLSLPGYTPGNPMTFKLYKTSADLETNEAEKTYYVGDDTFGFGTFSALSLDASVFNIQSLGITGGQFNLVSFNLFPRYASAWTVFGGMESLQIVYNHNGQVLIPAYNINTIGDINFLNGFYLYTDQAETIDYEGTYIYPETWDITVLPNKWNYISVLSRTPVAVTDVFDGFESDISIVQAASGDSWIPSQSINTIGNMQPGLGYKIALSGSNPITFNYPPAGSKSGIFAHESFSRENLKPDGNFFDFTETGLPYAVVVNLKPDFETPGSLTNGDEIALFDGNLCVGVAVYDGSGKFLMNAWKKDETQNLPGFTPGHLITAQIYRHDSGILSRHILKSSTGGLPVFGQGNYASVILNLMPGNIQPFNLNVHPNPFKIHTSLVLDLNRESLVRVNIYDRTGRLVKTLSEKFLTADIHHLSWDGSDLNGNRLNPGIYFIVAETSEQVITEKVIIMQ